MSTSSRKDLSTALKITGNNTRYKPLVMSDESVYDMARHYYTIEEISKRFGGISIKTLLEKHGEAFYAGRDNAMNKPRMLLNKIFDDFSHEDLNFARPDVPVHNLLKAIDTHARKYEGMGSKSEVTVHSNVPYDKIESVPNIIERPVEDE